MHKHKNTHAPSEMAVNDNKLIALTALYSADTGHPRRRWKRYVTSMSRSMLQSLRTSYLHKFIIERQAAVRCVTVVYVLNPHVDEC